jgi:hypothetical protein
MSTSTPQPATDPVESTKANQLIEKYEIPEAEPFISFAALKDRIRHHYELASDYYYSLWYPHPLSLTTQSDHKQGRAHSSRLLPHTNRHKGECPNPTNRPSPGTFRSSQRQQSPRCRLWDRRDLPLPGQNPRLFRYWCYNQR